MMNGALVVLLNVLPIADFYNNEYQRNRVSMVGRAAEVLFTLPNDLQYLENYSIFKIDNLDLVVEKNALIQGDVRINGDLTVDNVNRIDTTIVELLKVNGTLSVTSNANIEGALEVTGETHIKDSATVDNDLILKSDLRLKNGYVGEAGCVLQRET